MHKDGNDPHAADGVTRRERDSRHRATALAASAHRSSPAAREILLSLSVEARNGHRGGERETDRETDTHTQ